MTAALCVTVI